MPELPEVRNAVSRLNAAVQGQTINSVFINTTKLIRSDLKSFKPSIEKSKIIKVTNTAKFIRIELNNGNTILNHLRMTGKWRFEKVREERKHDHVIFQTNKGYIVYNDSRAFGTFEIGDTKTIFNMKPLSTIGNEPQDVNLDWLHKKLSGKRIAIKSALLDQNLVAGLGNIYVNEVLFKSKINPERPSNEITKKNLKLILKISHEVMEKATEMGGSSIQDYESFNGERGNYQTMLEVHKREGLPCNKCGNPILKTRVGGRGTYWCSHCQTN